ncbi:S24 family peptidase [Hahella ganghwensis]|uniref:S24 family peptidase n=1 Tax=Hahella ganghwensis TaxID=286420 RepID=UPI00036B0256|nr:S24 family peptidase [Hahella ganghwensis]
MVRASGDILIRRVRQERLRQIIDQRFDGVAKDYAAAVGIAPSQLSGYLSNSPSSRSVGEKAARNWEEKLGLDSGSLDDHRLLPAEKQRDLGFVPEALNNRPTSNNQTGIIVDELLRERGFDSESITWFTQPDSSMQARIPRGSLVAIEPRKDILDGNLYLIGLQNGQRVIRQVFHDPDGSFLLQPETPSYPVHKLSGDQVKVIGAVVWYGAFID